MGSIRPLLLGWPALAALTIGIPCTAAAQRDTAQRADHSALIATFDSAWLAMSRTYWDTALVNGRWRAAHDSLRLLARTATDEDAMRAMVRALMMVPNLSHFALIPRSAVTETGVGSDAGAAGAPGAPGRPGTTGLDVRMIGDTLVVWRVAAGSPAAQAGITPGTIITRLGTIGLDSIRTLLVPSADDDGAKLRQLVNTVAISRLGGRAGDSMRLTVQAPVNGRNGTAREHLLVRAPLSGHATRFGNLPTLVVRTTLDSVPLSGASLTYAPVIGFSAWFPVISPELDERLFAVRGAPAVIIDLRGNPGGVVGMLAGVSGHFLDTAASLGVMRARGATIGFAANPRRVSRAGERVPVITAPLAILVDGFTGSTSEFFASGMQALGRARVFGVSSAGQALPAVASRLPNGDVLMHAIADHEDAKGRRVEGVGVQPDEVTPLTRADLIAGKDAALEAARRWIMTQIPN